MKKDMTNIELPRDAAGHEIPLDTKVLYDECGTKVSVKEFLFRTSVENRRTEWTIKAAYEGNFYYNSFKPKNMHLTRPDSWERLEEDLDRGSDICDYYEDCPMEMYGKSCSECKKAALKNIASRIRKLRGED